MRGRSAREIWEAALGELQVQVTRSNYLTWLKDTVGLEYDDGSFVVGAPTTFATEWLERRLHSLIKKTLMGIVGHPVELQFQVYQSNDELITPTRGPNTGTNSQFNPRYTFSTFVVGSCNQVARAAAERVANNPGRDYNPLFIYGGVGLGKTHLLHAIGHVALARGFHVLYVSSEQFTNEYVNAIQKGKMADFRKKYRSVDLLLIDDIQFLAARERTQEEFFHTFNDLYSTDHHIIISSDRFPKAMPLLEDRLRSRFQGGLITEIEPPDLETRLAILQAKAEEQQAKVPLEVLELIARTIQNTIRDLEGSLNRVVAYAKLTRAELTLELANQALADLTPDNPSRRSLTPGIVLQSVSSYFKIAPEELTGPRRDKLLSTARHVAMYLLREETGQPLAEIGRAFGGRKHTTVLHGCQKTASEMTSNNKLRRNILEIKDLLYSQKS